MRERGGRERAQGCMEVLASELWRREEEGLVLFIPCFTPLQPPLISALTLIMSGFLSPSCCAPRMPTQDARFRSRRPGRPRGLPEAAGQGPCQEGAGPGQAGAPSRGRGRLHGGTQVSFEGCGYECVGERRRYVGELAAEEARDEWTQPRLASSSLLHFLPYLTAAPLTSLPTAPPCPPSAALPLNPKP